MGYVKHLFRACVVAIACLVASVPAAHSAIINAGDLTIIDMAGNASDELRYLDMSFSTNRSLANALANAQLTHNAGRVEARRFVPEEHSMRWNRDRSR